MNPRLLFKNKKILLFSIVALIAIISIYFLVTSSKQSSLNVASPAPIPTISPMVASDLFESKEGGFRIKFSHPPSFQSGKLPVKDFTADYLQYVYNDPESVSSMVEVVTFPKNYLKGTEIKNAAEGITQSIQAAASGSTLLYSEFSTYKNHVAMDGLIQIGSRYLRVKTIIVGDKVYMVSTLSKDKTDATFNKFMNSFELE
jgi:hypothetical protein